MFGTTKGRKTMEIKSEYVVSLVAVILLSYAAFWAGRESYRRDIIVADTGETCEYKTAGSSHQQYVFCTFRHGDFTLFYYRGECHTAFGSGAAKTCVVDEMSGYCVGICGVRDVVLV